MSGMLVNSVSDYRAAYRQLGTYVWPGGYPAYVILHDGARLCHACEKTERRNLIEALADYAKGWPATDWLPIARAVFWESSEPENCAHCHCEIESAYGLIEESGSTVNKESSDA